MHRKSLFSPGISAAVAIDGQLVWAGSAGWANLERQKAVTPETQFRISSSSESLTAALLAKMVESNKLDLDALFSPGESFQYSSLGTVILSAVM